jgi:hypothetical protein
MIQPLNKLMIKLALYRLQPSPAQRLLRLMDKLATDPMDADTTGTDVSAVANDDTGTSEAGRPKAPFAWTSRGGSYSMSYAVGANGRAGQPSSGMPTGGASGSGGGPMSAPQVVDGHNAG